MNLLHKCLLGISLIVFLAIPGNALERQNEYGSDFIKVGNGNNSNSWFSSVKNIHKNLAQENVYWLNSLPDCPTLISPIDAATNVPLIGGDQTLFFSWLNNSTDIDENQFFLGTDPDDLANIGSVGGDDVELNLYNLMYSTTYYWSIVPEDSDGEAENCSVFSFTTAASNITDTDGDGVPDDEDCSPNDIDVYQGASCDDGDDDTVLDTIDNDCICAGSTAIVGQFCQSGIGVSEGMFSVSAIAYVGGYNDACFDGATASYWFQYTASQSGIAAISSDGTEVDTRLSVFDACDATACLASSDDINIQSNLASSTAFQVNQGEIYFVQWDNAWSSEGFNFSIVIDSDPTDTDGDGISDFIDNCADVSNADQLNIDEDSLGDACDDDIDGDTVLNEDDCAPNDAEVFTGQSCDDGNSATYNDVLISDCTCAGVPAEPNSSCANAALVGLGMHSTNGPVVGSAASNICFSEATHAVWYVYESETTGALKISSVGTATDTRLSVYADCASSACLASNDDVSFPSIPGSEVIIPVVPSQSYYIEWDDRWTTNGFEFSLSFEEVDSDEDGWTNSEDNCPFISNPGQEDLDGDGVGDICDTDIDGDDYLNNADCAPFDGAIYPGATCDDGDAATSNDMIQTNCGCEGVIAPTNFNCFSATEVGEGTFYDAGPFQSTSATNLCEMDATSSNWYRYTPSGSGVVVVHSCFDGVDTRLSVFNDDCDDLNCITSNDDSNCGVGTTYASALAFIATAGTSYFLEWDDRWSTQGFNFVIWLDPETTDTDSDGIVDFDDNCYEVPNDLQEDFDFDGIGDVCDDDVDGDLVDNDVDCDPLNGGVYQGAQCNDGNPNTFYDAIDENCVCVGYGSELDSDEDGVVDVEDNCVDIANADQNDLDQDGIGDACDNDIDGDFVLNEVDCNPTDDTAFEILGTPCDDGNGLTVLDEIGDNCECIGNEIPANSDCAEATDVSVGTYNTTAIVGNGASPNCGSSAENALWYSFTAPENGVININSSNTLGLNTNLSVFGDCAGTCLGSNDNINAPTDVGSSLDLVVTEGETYLIQWDDMWNNDPFEFVIQYIVGVEAAQLTLIDDFLLYPNPTRNEISIQFTSRIYSEATLIISDATSRKVRSESINCLLGTNQHVISVSDFDSGLYVLEIVFDDYKTSRRFVKID